MTRIPLRELAREANPRRRSIQLRPIETTLSQAQDLAAINLHTVRVWEQGRSRVMETYGRALAAQDALTRDDASWIAVVIEALVGEAGTQIGLFSALFDGWANSLVAWHTRRIVSNLKYASNVELSSAMFSPAGQTVGDALQRNVALIRDVSDQTRGRISDIVFRGLQQRLPARDVAKEIAEATGMARKRALRIASDQTVKLSAALDRQRMVDLGFDEFEWRHSRKRHPREWHKDRDGKFFRLDDPVLVGDMPGDQPFCGCKAAPHMELD